MLVVGKQHHADDQKQYELREAGAGKVGGTKVRAFKLNSLAEGCVADNDLGFVYFSEETVGIWKFDAEPDGSVEGQLVARVGDNGLTADVEGLTIYYAAQGGGYLIASSQGNNTYLVYERAGQNRYLLTVDPKAGQIDDVSDTDGICVTSCPTSTQFTKGLFVVQDGTNAGGNQNFKLYAWEDVAAGRLLIDTACQPREAAGGPRLTIQQTSQSIRVSWPEQFTGYRLQANNDLSTGTWNDLGTVSNPFTEPLPASSRFYRLITP